MIPVSALLEQEAVRTAIAVLPARAEAAAKAAAGTKSETLTATYVDPALTQQLASPNHQILYGRRGAGKTHTLLVMEKRLMGRSGEIVIYADLRELGDTRPQPPQEQAAGYIRQLLAIVEREFARRGEDSYSFAQVYARPHHQLDAFHEVIDQQGFAVSEIMSERSAGESAERNTSLRAALEPTSPGVSASLASGRERHSAEREAIRRIPVEQVDFTAVSGALQKLSRAGDLRRLTLLLDEWSEVQPAEAQPYLAEYIKRVFFPVEGLSVKIAAIQYRSRVGVRLPNGAVRGFEEYADLFPLTMLDESAFSYDRDPAEVEKMFAELLYRHLTVILAQAASEGGLPRKPVTPPPRGPLQWLARHRPGRRAPPAYEDDIISRVADELRQPDWSETFFEAAGNAFMRSEFGVSGAAELVADLFEGKAFGELSRGAQGVPRDFASILQNAVFASNTPKLTQHAMRTAIRAFHTAKLENLHDAERQMLTDLTQKITGRHARCFLADRDLTRDETFQTLVDQRLLHRLQPRVPDPQDPARTYDAYTLDYGSYVLLLAEGKLPDDDLSDRLTDEPNATVAPYSDGRRMRRIIIGLADLEAENAEPATGGETDA